MIVAERKLTELGSALKEFRVRTNITPQELAEIIGVSTNTIHLWETKVCKPSMGSQLILSHILAEPLLDIIVKAKSKY